VNTAISFRYGRPALKDFPRKLWCKLLSRHCKGEFIFGYAELDEMQIQEGIGRLAQAFN
jgi:GntR family transcriptional regulator/MocR family aminotransferase